jgi:DNA-directed RNA polymerase specialized sigma subunit
MRDLAADMQKARERERMVMALRRSGMTYAAIAERLGVTPSRVSQIMAKGERIEQFGRQGYVGICEERDA